MDDESALPPPQPGPTWDQLSEASFKVAWASLRDLADAEDIVQEALSDLAVEDPAPVNPEAWITTVTQRRVVDLVRSRYREVRRLERAAAVGAVPKTVAPDVAAEVVGDMHADELLDALTPSERDVIERSVLEDQPRREIAETLGMGEESVKTLRARGVQRMRKIEEEGGNP